MSRLSTAEGRTRDNAYIFYIRVTDTRTNSQIFVGSSDPIIKESVRADVGL